MDWSFPGGSTKGQSMPGRDWRQARAKVAAEDACRACGALYDLQAAHIVPRSRINAGQGAEDDRNIIPLCLFCHEAQHRGKLELLPYLTFEEQGYIAGIVGIEEAHRRTTRRAA